MLICLKVNIKVTLVLRDFKQRVFGLTNSIFALIAIFFNNEMQSNSREVFLVNYYCTTCYVRHSAMSD